MVSLLSHGFLCSSIKGGERETESFGRDHSSQVPATFRKDDSDVRGQNCCNTSVACYQFVLLSSVFLTAIGFFFLNFLKFGMNQK